jgi:hypothetical protein
MNTMAFVHPAAFSPTEAHAIAYCTLAFNPAAFVTCGTLFRLQDSDKANLGYDKIIKFGTDIAFWSNLSNRVTFTIRQPVTCVMV